MNSPAGIRLSFIPMLFTISSDALANCPVRLKFLKRFTREGVNLLSFRLTLALLLLRRNLGRQPN